jgi:amino acid adenylation domain-containing protein
VSAGTGDSGGRVRLTPVEFDPFAERPPDLVLPLTEPQREMWAACAMGPEASCSYNQCFPLRLTGRLSVSALSAALRRLCERHPALRAVFSPEADFQTIRGAADVDLPVVDLSGWEDGARETEVRRRIDRETHEPFDLETGPLIRGALLRESPNRHLLILTGHHIVCDGWSASIAVRDLGALYAAELSGMEPRLEAPASYEAYVRTRAAGTPDDGAVADEAWWAARFQDAVPALELPLDRARPAAKSYRGRQIDSRFDGELYREIRKVGAKNGATVYATFLAAFEILLHRLTGQTDFVVGIPVAGQAAIEDGDLVGHCVNTLPLRVTIDPDAPFAAHLRAARKDLVDAQDHARLTFGGLVRRLNLKRDPSRTPLVDTTFNVDRAGAPPPFGDLSVELLPPPKSFVNFEIAFNLVDDGGGVSVECAFNTDLFDEATIRRWLGHYETLLRAIAANPEEAVAALSLLTDAERADLVDGGLRAEFPADTCPHRRFEAQAALRPDAIAVSCGDERVTYAELDGRANRLAHRLLEAGVRPGKLVGLCAERSVDLVVALLGILKAGGAYLPVDLSYPDERIAFMLRDAEAVAVVTQRPLAGRLPADGPPSVYLDDPMDLGPGTRPAASVGPHDPMYVIYTSGSTGQPKGTLITHHAVDRLLRGTEGWYGFGPDDVWTLFHSIAFDFSVWEVWGALAYGGRLVVVPYWDSRSPEALFDLLVRERVTVLNQTPSAFRQLVPIATADGAPRAEALRYVIFGGEALDLASLAPWFGRFGDERPRLVNMYGITETTVHVTYRPIRSKDVLGRRGSLIGEPIPDLRVLLLDRRGQPVPVGVPGEMFVGGAGLAQGYWKRPDLTAARFIEDPFREGQRLYRTGDLARRLADGDLEYLGRIDHQVKIRGFRIELGEIEAALSRHPSVRECVVIAREDEPGDKRLAAYVASAEEPEPLVDDLRRLLKASLPDYMVPSAFVVLGALPLTANGKVDRKALPAPEVTRPAGARKTVSARTPTESTVAAIWSVVLKQPEIGVEDDFFEMGGHSIQAAQIMTRLRAAFPLDLPLRLLFQSPTVKGLAAAIDALAWTAGRSAASSGGGSREEFEL